MDSIPSVISVTAREFIVILVASDVSFIREVTINTGMFMAIPKMLMNHVKKIPYGLSGASKTSASVSTQTLHEFHEKKDSKRRCDTTTPESIHTKDESKRGSAFAFIFGVN